jgi:hypothetical protein
MTSSDFLDSSSWSSLFAREFGTTYSERKFTEYFGVTPDICCILWARCQNQTAIDLLPKYLLWFLHFIKTNKTTYQLATACHVSTTWVSQWVWIMADILDEQLDEVT